MRSSPLLALMAAFGPVAVLSSPRPPPGWEIEIITIEFDTARFPHHTPHVPGATATTADTSLGAGEPTGTLTDSSPTITSEPEPGDECENEGSSSLSLTALDTYPITTGSVSAYGADTDLSATSSSMTSSATTLSTSLVAKHRRQADDPSPTTTTSASIPAGVTAPDGYAGTGSPSLTSNTEGLPSITPNAFKKVKGSGCARGPVKSVSKGAKMNTSTGQSALMDAYGGATSSSSGSSASASTSATSSSSAAVGM